MGTNYYIEAEIGNACPVCKHRKEIEKELHIGKFFLKINPLKMNNRSCTPRWDHPPLAYTSWEKFHELNHSMEGPNGMIRSTRNDGHGGDEPWDLHENEFC